MQKLKKSGYLVIITTLMLLVIGTMIVGISLAYFSKHSPLAIDKSQPLNITIEAIENGSTAHTITPEEINNSSCQKICITTTKTCDCLVRIKFEENNSGRALQVSLDDNWIRDENNYYYSKNPAMPNNAIELQTNLEKQTDSSVNIIVETLSNNFDYVSNWIGLENLNV